MAIKKSDLYQKIWDSCDELRGGMDASQYKDYVLTLLFIKYVSDKAKGEKFPEIIVPKGASFDDMLKLKGKDDIGDKINKKIIGAIAKANDLTGTIDKADFDDDGKLGSGKEKIDKLTNLISIFESKDLDFSKNKADGDDILGDAYEYLMKHFATQSGKSKGQFYTPSEVSRILAKVIGISPKNTKASTTVYDPTCGSGSLLLKVSAEANNKATLYGQEKDESTVALARMNMVLHQNAAAVKNIYQGNTLANPKLKDKDSSLMQFDYVVANPPFSDKRWSTGISPSSDEYGRFQDFGCPPDKNGDYAYLLHILRSLKSKGKGAIILPHGVLFRGNAEESIRKKLIQSGFIKAIIGLPPNLFYGTGIPACIIVLDKENSTTREGIFIIDAGRGFIKDGNKNKLREQDIHKIIDIYKSRQDTPGFSRFVKLPEIESNEYNMNISRYIESVESEIDENVEGHLFGGIPKEEIESFQKFWNECPNIKKALFKTGKRNGYYELGVDKEKITETIFKHSEFKAFSDKAHSLFDSWLDESIKKLMKVKAGDNPKDIIHNISEELLKKFPDESLIDKYSVYQHLMNFWDDVMQDDLYVITADGWESGSLYKRLTKLNQKKKEVEIKGLDGIEGLLISPKLIIKEKLTKEREQLHKLEQEIEELNSNIISLIEENNGDEDVFSELDHSKKPSKSFLKEKKKDLSDEKESDDYKKLVEIENHLLKLSECEKAHKSLLIEIEKMVLAQYPKLEIKEIKEILINKKWITVLKNCFKDEVEKVSYSLGVELFGIINRYEMKLSDLSNSVDLFEKEVFAHLNSLGFDILKELVTGKKRIPRFAKSWDGKYKKTDVGEIPSDWSVLNIAQDTSLKARIGWQALTRKEYLERGDYFLVTGTDFDNGLIDWSTCSYVSKERFDMDHNIQLRENDVLVTKDGTIGKVAVVDSLSKPATLNSGVFVIRSTNEKLHQKYLYLIFMSSFFSNFLRKITAGSTITHLYQKDFTYFSFPVPPVDEQKEIFKVYNSLFLEEKALERKLDKYRRIKHGMMKALLNGEERLV